MNKPLVTSGQDWSFEQIEEIWDYIYDIAVNKYGLNLYPVQFDLVSAEQMLDAMSSVGLPVNYQHWSFGKNFIEQDKTYKLGRSNLPYELVINSSPSVTYLMEENTMLMQTLVCSHITGHNHFFKNNYLFKQWTDAEGINDYLTFAKNYIKDCEEKYGVDAVELTLDAAHALKLYGVDKYKRPRKLSAKEENERQDARMKFIESQVNELWNTIPKSEHKKDQEEYRFPSEPQENLLYFIAKNAPKLETWQREILRIVYKVAQYFYPQMQTKLMNEGTATYFHYKIIHDLYDRGIIDHGAMLEFYTSHTGVVFQPEYDDPRFTGINPYALGFAMMQDIERISTNPTDEDREWFKYQDWVGRGDYIEVIKEAIENYKDESFVMQYLSPKVIRDFKLFSIYNDSEEDSVLITGIHDEDGYKDIRKVLSMQYDISYAIPNIQVNRVDIWGDRTLELVHNIVNDQHLDVISAEKTLDYIEYLWGYEVHLDTISGDDVTFFYSSGHDDDNMYMQ